MESFYTIIALLTAGISLITGLISLFTGLQRDGEKVDVVFGVMGIGLFIFFMIPPIGFILLDKAPYPVEIEVKRIFIWSYYALMPWFFELYTGYKKRAITITIDVLAVISYMIMVFTTVDSMKSLWVMVVITVSGLNLYYGLAASLNQIKMGRRKE